MFDEDVSIWYYQSAIRISSLSAWDVSWKGAEWIPEFPFECIPIDLSAPQLIFSVLTSGPRSPDADPVGIHQMVIEIAINREFYFVNRTADWAVTTASPNQATYSAH